jgi:14-3-3 protein epsilon
MSKEKLTKAQLKFLISTCLSLELYDKAYDYSYNLIELNKNILDEEERNLFMRSIKGKLFSPRNGWKTIIDFENYEGNKFLLPKNLVDEKRKMLEKEIKDLCFKTIDTIKILEKVNNDNDICARIFYLKLKADYLRYYGEIATEEEFEKYKDECKQSYDEAYELCKGNLEYSSPLFLSVALNYSVFLYSLTDELKLAYDKVNDVYKQAILKLAPEQKIPEVDNMIKSIEENLTIWKIELSDYNNN